MEIFCSLPVATGQDSKSVGDSDSQQCFERQYLVLPSLNVGGFHDYFDHWVCDNSYLVYSYTLKTLTSSTSHFSEYPRLKSELPNETLSYPTADIVKNDLEVISGDRVSRLSPLLSSSPKQYWVNSKAQHILWLRLLNDCYWSMTACSKSWLEQ